MEREKKEAAESELAPVPRSYMLIYTHNRCAAIQQTVAEEIL
jgi:hypothetical protein